MLEAHTLISLYMRKPRYPYVSAWSKLKPTIIPPRNIAGTATMDFTESRATPDRPWPLVQPEAIRLPKIDRKPPKKACTAGTPDALPNVPDAMEEMRAPMMAKER
eukprot:764511-Hanusia_phi.AAC.3